MLVSAMMSEGFENTPSQKPHDVGGSARLPEHKPSSNEPPRYRPLKDGLVIETLEQNLFFLRRSSDSEKDIPERARGLCDLAEAGMSTPASLIVAPELLSSWAVDSNELRQTIQESLSILGMSGLLKISVDSAPGTFSEKERAIELQFSAAPGEAFSSSLNRILSDISNPQKAFLSIQELQANNSQPMRFRQYGPLISGTVNTSHPDLITLEFSTGYGGDANRTNHVYTVSKADFKISYSHDLSPGLISTTIKRLDNSAGRNLSLGETPSPVYDINHKRLVLKLAQDAMSFSRAQMGTRLEFMFPDFESLEKVSPIYLEKKLLPVLERDFARKLSGSGTALAQSSLVLGQEILETSDVFYLKVAPSDMPRLPIRDMQQNLAGFNKEAGAGYILIVDLPSKRELLSLSVLVENLIKPENYSNAAAIVILDRSPLGDKDMHYRAVLSELFQRKGRPFMIVQAHESKPLINLVNKHENTDVDPYVLNGSLKHTVYAGRGIYLAAPIQLFVDEYANKGSLTIE